MNHSVMNEKQGDQIQFSPEKTLAKWKYKWIHQHYPKSLSTNNIKVNGGSCYKVIRNFVVLLSSWFPSNLMLCTLIQWRCTCRAKVRVPLTREIRAINTDIDFTDEPLVQYDVLVVNNTFVDYGDKMIANKFWGEHLMYTFLELI